MSKTYFKFSIHDKIEDIVRDAMNFANENGMRGISFTKMTYTHTTDGNTAFLIDTSEKKRKLPKEDKLLTRED